MLGVSVFGESEYILAFIKLLFITGFYIFAIIYAAGGIPHHKPPNLFKEMPLAHGFGGIVSAFVYAGVFFSGVESVSMTAAESKNPKKAIPLAVRQTFWRILYVYFGISISYGITVAWNDPNLSSGSKTLKSPMTIAIMNAGWNHAGDFVNAVILITCLSSINSGIYIGSRSLYNLAKDGMAPKIFKRVDKRGVPWVAVHSVHLFGFLSIMNYSTGAVKAYGYIINLAGVSAFIVWTAIIFVHFRFRRGWVKQGYALSDLPFKSPLYPFPQLIGFVIGIILTLVQGWTVFKPFAAGDFVDAYILLPLFFVIWLSYKFIKKTKWVSYEDMDFINGRRVIEPTYSNEQSSDKETEDGKKTSFWNRVWKEV